MAALARRTAAFVAAAAAFAAMAAAPAHGYVAGAYGPELECAPLELTGIGNFWVYGRTTGERANEPFTVCEDAREALTERIVWDVEDPTTDIGLWDCANAGFMREASTASCDIRNDAGTAGWRAEAEPVQGDGPERSCGTIAAGGRAFAIYGRMSGDRNLYAPTEDECTDARHAFEGFFITREDAIEGAEDTWSCHDGAGAHAGSVAVCAYGDSGGMIAEAVEAAGQPPGPGVGAGVGPCSRHEALVGGRGVKVCADRLDGEGDSIRMSGNVVVEDSIAVDTDVVIDGDEISSDGRASIGVVRADGVQELLMAGFTIDASRMAEEASIGRSDLTRIYLFDLEVLGMDVGGIAMLPGNAAYLDRSSGGGIVFALKPAIFGAGKLAQLGRLRDVITEGSLFGGFYVDGSRFQVIGGQFKASAQVTKGVRMAGEVIYREPNLRIPLPDGTYDFADPVGTWEWKGAVELGFVRPTPEDPDATVKRGVEASVLFRRGDFDGMSLGTSGIGRIPIADGFYLDKFGARLTGLTGDFENPLVIEGSAGGGWGPLDGKWERLFPGKKLLGFEGKINLTNWTNGEPGLSLDDPIALSLNTKIFIIDEKLLSGKMSVGGRLNPFKVWGSAEMGMDLTLGSISQAGSIAIQGNGFTAMGDVRGKVYGKTVGRGAGIISDRGMGATVKVPLFGWMGMGVEWDEVTHFPPEADMIGSDVTRYRTVAPGRVRAAARVPAEREIAVAPGQAALVVHAYGAGAEIAVRDPRGRLHDRRSRDYWSHRVPGRDGTVVAVARPMPGRWRVVTRGANELSVAEVPPLGRLHAKLKAGRRRSKLSWRGAPMPPAARVTVYAGNTRGRPGRVLARGRRTKGRMTIARRRLARGRNYVTLVVSERGLPFQRVALRKPLKR